VRTASASGGRTKGSGGAVHSRISTRGKRVVGEIRRRLGHSLMILVVALAAVAGASHATAISARAACDGGYAFTWAVGHAQGAIVGRVISILVDDNGAIWATAVRVERAEGIHVGRVYRGRMFTGSCGEDEPRVGAHVVVLLGVTDPLVPSVRGDLFYTIGRTVTPAQASRVGTLLPDSAIEQAVQPNPSSRPIWLPAAVAGGTAFVVFLVRPRRRRASRGGRSMTPPR